MEYENDSPAAWDARVARGARYLDEALLTHDWRDVLLAHDFAAEALDYGIDILDQLCRAGFTGVCREVMSGWLLQTHRLDLFTVGMDYTPDEFDALHEAWARYLATDAALQVTA